MKDIEIDRLREKALFSGWSRAESTKIIIKLLDELVRYKSVCKERDAHDFSQALSINLDEHAVLVLEFETLEEQFEASSQGGVHAFVDMVMAESGWSALVDESKRIVTFYKKIEI